MDKYSDNRGFVISKDKQTIPVTIAMGDGIGPEIMKATLKILNASGANIRPDYIEIGEKAYEAGHTSGITADAWESIMRNKVVLKAPITTPQGKGYKSLNVTMRKSLSLYANVRPVHSLHPYVQTPHEKMNVVIVRENEEDLYAGIEHQQTQDVVQCLKLITRPGCERIIRYAFEYAKANGRKKVTCMLKDNIMKLTDGLFHRVFDEIAREYPDIEANTQIIDIGAARLAAKPEQYDVVVTSNLYGDIISDIVAEISGSVGLAGSANVGDEIAMFEAIHGSAPDIAGKKIANPSGLINAAVLMLEHIGRKTQASLVKNAWLKTIEDGIHTADIYKEGVSKELVNTDAFADAVVARIGQYPTQFEVYQQSNTEYTPKRSSYTRPSDEKVLVGIDVFLDWGGNNPNKIGQALDALGANGMKLKMITNRGVKVYPGGIPYTFCTDHWRCRFIAAESQINGVKSNYNEVSFERILYLLSTLHQQGFDVIKTENLYEFSGRRGFSLGQGE